MASLHPRHPLCPRREVRMTATWQELPALALVGTYPPRRCGIATFTRDLRDALVDLTPPDARTPLVVAVDRGRRDPPRYPPEVTFRLKRSDVEAYGVVAAQLVPQTRFAIVGATHPEVRLRNGERYRAALAARRSRYVRCARRAKPPEGSEVGCACKGHERAVSAVGGVGDQRRPASPQATSAADPRCPTPPPGTARGRSASSAYC